MVTRVSSGRHHYLVVVPHGVLCVIGMKGMLVVVGVVVGCMARLCAPVPRNEVRWRAGVARDRILYVGGTVDERCSNGLGAKMLAVTVLLWMAGPVGEVWSTLEWWVRE